MKKTYTLVVAVALLVLNVFLPINTALAQSYYGSNYYFDYNKGTYYNNNTYNNNAYNNTCTNLTSNLYKGVGDSLTGGQVSALQSFLISNGYLRIAYPTGYFGAATTMAVVQYQSTHGLYPNGYADVPTRASIQSVSCGYVNNYVEPVNYCNDGYYNNYNYNGNYNYNNCYNDYDYQDRPQISRISPRSAEVGDTVTIYGSDFTKRENTVHFGNGGETGLSSSDGKKIKFTIPRYINPCDVNETSYCSTYSQRVKDGRYPVYVSNDNGRTDVIYLEVYN